MKNELLNQLLREEALRRWRKVLALRKQGLTFTQIGKKFNLSKQRIYQVIKRYADSGIDVSPES